MASWDLKKVALRVGKTKKNMMRERNEGSEKCLGQILYDDDCTCMHTFHDCIVWMAYFDFVCVPVNGSLWMAYLDYFLCASKRFFVDGIS